jgi:ABC-type antimicrobial peptide transport system permease subunit
MVSTTTQKIFVVIIVLLLLTLLGYMMLNGEPKILDETIISSNTEMAGQEILALVDKLEAVSIDQDFFSSLLFNGLKDFTQIIFPEARGRINPFAVIGSEGSL